MLTEVLAARAGAMPTTATAPIAATVSAPKRSPTLLRTHLLRDGGRVGWPPLRGSLGLTENGATLPPGAQDQDDDPGEERGARDHDGAQSELVAELALNDGA